MYRISLFSGDDLISVWIFDDLDQAVSFHESFISLIDPLIGKNPCSIFASSEDLKLLMHEIESPTDGSGSFLRSFLIYK